MATLKLEAAEAAIASSSIPQTDKEALRNSLRSAVNPLPDNWIYRIVVIALGLAMFTPIVALLKGDQESMKLLLPIATGALGALAGLLAPSPAGNG